MTWLENLEALNDYYIGNLAAIILVSMLIAANVGKFSGRRKEYQMLKFMLLDIGLYGITEILSVILEGIPGTGISVLLYLLNAALFVLNMMLELGWVQFFASHLSYTISKRTRLALWGMFIAGLVLLVVNVFHPIIFDVQNNVYHLSSSVHLVYYAIAGLCFIYSIHIYRECKRNGGIIKYFPVWMYIVPSLIGIILELLLGSSMMSICNAIAIGSVLASMQQEAVFRDRLTGLYNRAYLEQLKSILEKAKSPYVSGIMLDLNDFKRINDDFGHSEGDQALIIAAGLIREGVGSYGDVIRYAGDEFVVILNTWDKTQLMNCAERIRQVFDHFNQESEKPYQLNASVGYANFNAGTQTVNEFLNMIDKNMYENKRLYYQKHQVDRRKKG